MKSVLALLVIITMLPLQTLASCKQSVELIEKGSQAPCTGFLFSPEAEAKVAQDYSDLQYYKALNERLEERRKLTDKELFIIDKRLQLYIEQSEILSERLHKREKHSEWQKVIWFSLGVLATGLVVNGARRL